MVAVSHRRGTDSSAKERTMMARLTLTTCLLALAACGEAQNTLGPAAVDGGPEAQFAATAAGQTDDIAALIAAQDAAWAAKDAAAYAATYTTDAEVINPVGGFLVGSAVIQAQHAFLFNPVNGPFRASTSVWALRDLIFLTGTTALVKLDVTLTGYSSLPPNLPAVQPGVVMNRVTWVAVKRDGAWRITHQQMTPLPAP
jgi:uncharacterized protein (TIGR02246 family)